MVVGVEVVMKGVRWWFGWVWLYLGWVDVESWERGGVREGGDTGRVLWKGGQLGPLNLGVSRMRTKRRDVCVWYILESISYIALDFC